MKPRPDTNQSILAAIRHQHPEWVSPDGECTPCESYLHELAESTNHHQPNPENHE